MEKKARVGVVQEDGLGAIAVVHVEIKHRHAFGAGGQRFEGGNRDIVQVAKAHRPVARGVMPRRAHQAENRFPGPRGLQRVQRRADGGPGVIHKVRVSGSVLVEVLQPAQPGKMFGGVRAQDGGVIAGAGFAPGNRQFGLAPQPFPGRDDALGPFRVARVRITGAALVSNDSHLAGGTPTHTDRRKWRRQSPAGPPQRRAPTAGSAAGPPWPGWRR